MKHTFLRLFSPDVLKAKLGFFGTKLIYNAAFLLLSRFYYGTIDNWCPLSFYESLKEKVPNMNAVVCEKKMEHAFVLSSSNEMGEIVAEWCSEDFL